MAPTKRKRPSTQRSTYHVKAKPKRGGALRFVMGLLALVFVVLFLGAMALLVPNGVICATTRGDFRSIENAADIQEMKDADPQAILVLGAGLKSDGTPSTVLRDRLDVGIELYEEGVAPKIIMSGDNSLETYNEVMAMCNYAAKQGVPRDDIFCDHGGVNTYTSMYRAKNVFGVERCVVVTQEYHLYRAVYEAKNFGIQTFGVACDRHDYNKMDQYESREFLARMNGFFMCLTNVEPEVKSSPVSLDGSGRVTQWWYRSS